MTLPSCGMLQHVVLHKLSDGPKSGYQLCSLIEEETGRRPSYGSIYPILERMSVAGEVTVRVDGRRKMYALTPKGRQAATVAAKQRERLVDDEMVRIKKLMALMDMDPQPMLAVLGRARKGNPPLGRVTASMFALRDLIFRMAADGRAERNAVAINKLIVDVTRRLERMR